MMLLLMMKLATTLPMVSTMMTMTSTMMTMVQRLLKCFGGVEILKVSQDEKEFFLLKKPHSSPLPFSLVKQAELRRSKKNLSEGTNE